MKNLLKTSLFALLISGSLTAQTIVNELKSTKIEKMESAQGEIVTVKTVKEEVQPVVFDPSDAGKLNQDRIPSQVHVDKTVLIDNDDDTVYEKKVELNYIKDTNEKLDYKATSNGVRVATSKNSSKLLTKEGTYKVDAKDVDNMTVKVENVSKK